MVTPFRVVFKFLSDYNLVVFIFFRLLAFIAWFIAFGCCISLLNDAIMEDHSSYNLIQVVDPRRINIPINDRFAKLTLSSNKKNNPGDLKLLHQEKRESASRNLMEQFSLVQSNNENDLLPGSGSLTRNSDSEISYMESLYVTENSTQEGGSSKICGRLDQKSADFLNNTPEAYFLNENVICLSSESSFAPAEEIEQLTEEEEDAITVSDSSHSKSDPSKMVISGLTLSCDTNRKFLSSNVDKGKAEHIEAFLRDVSIERKKTANKINNIMENTFLDGLPLKIESIQKEKPAEAPGIATADTESMIIGDSFNVKIPATEESNKIVNVEQSKEKSSSSIFKLNQMSLKMKSKEVKIGSKAQLVATADTESMTPEENYNIEFPNFEKERKNRVQNLDSAMTSADCSSFEVPSDENTNQKRSSRSAGFNLSSGNKIILSNKANNSVDYCVIEESINVSSSSEKACQSWDESVIISETDDETDNNHQLMSSRPYNNETEKNSSMHSNMCKSNNESEKRDSVTEINEISNKFGSINISARINIKIHIPSDSSDTSDAESATPMTTRSFENDLSKSNYETENRKINATKSVDNSVNCKDVENEMYLPEAEKLLTELYGNSWQTPDVLRTLKRSSYQKSNETLQGITIPQVRRNIYTDLNSIGVTTPNTSSKTRVVPKRSAKAVEEKKKESPSWRQCLNNGSDLDDPSDDDDADDTEIDEGLINSKMKNHSKISTKMQTQNPTRRASEDDEIIYLDLTKHEVEVEEQIVHSPPADTDKKFISNLEEILRTCRRNEKPKLPCTPQSSKTKRKLFTPCHDYEDFESESEKQTPLSKAKAALNDDDDLLYDLAIGPFDKRGISKRLPLINKPLQSVKNGNPIFEIQSQELKNSKQAHNPLVLSALQSKSLSEKGKTLTITPPHKYTFLKSLDVRVSKSFCHPEALSYRENYHTQKQELSKVLYDLFNETVFNNKLEVQVIWNKRLCSTAGRCLNKKKAGIRLSLIELSDKVLTSADRLRCTLIHEMCHAAAWIFDAAKGHGATWKQWACRANSIFPELPKIGVCHQYDIEYKYTYKCCLCGAKSHAHSTSRKVENIRCSYCYGAIEIFLNKKDKQGNIIPTPLREPTGFAKFVKENYKTYKQFDRKHSEIMKILSAEFVALKINQKN
uniref:SprT-like domain-containing protein n=1 Tax=Glossina pallidipes TaxID=7398 RepID=A0A1A9ZBC1_GLOPL